MWGDDLSGLMINDSSRARVDGLSGCEGLLFIL